MMPINHGKLRKTPDPTVEHAGDMNACEQFVCTRRPACSMRFILLEVGVVLSLMANVQYVRRFTTSKRNTVIQWEASSKPNTEIQGEVKKENALIAGQTSPLEPGNSATTTIKRMLDGAVKNVPYALEMEETHLNLSARQQLKFHARKDLIAKHFPKTMLYAATANEANILTKYFAYL
jgi:hypothetical protein